ncbi:hypothetical protein BGX21_008650 [Mortierella sp. AD011]|nr:hypothetical protein BGX20_008705 [Mortierella sp. AD010]KAF9397636.1 hypothetical protein BGX21_008650 [Mortierella sp. AD011]
MAHHERGQRLNVPQEPSQDTIWEEDSEDSPLLPPHETPEIVDPTSAYVKILAENLPWYKRPSAHWLFPVYGLASTSAGMLTSSIGQFQAALLCKEYMNRHPPINATELAASAVSEFSSFLLESAADNSAFPLRPAPACRVPEIQAFTAKTLGIIEVIGGIAAMLTIGYYASLSDKHGRIKIMILGFANNLFMLCAMIVMGKWWDQIGLPLLVISALISGLTGGIGLAATMSLAYAADCTDPSKRSLVYSWLHAGLFMGLAIGPYLGGSITRATGTFLTIICIDIVSALISLSLLILVMPESIPGKQPAHIRKLYEQATKSNQKQQDDDDDDDDSKKPQEQNVPWHSHFLGSLRFFKPDGHNTNLILLAAISFLQTLALKGTFSVLILYTNLIFNWTEYEDGILFSMSSMVRLFSLLILLPIFVHIYRKLTGNNATTTTAPSPQPASYGTHGSYSENSRRPHGGLDNNDEGPLDLFSSHPDQVIVGGLNDPNVASSLEHLGEAALNLSDDEESFQERRRRQSTANSTATWSSDRTRIPASPSSPTAGKKVPSNSPAATQPKDQKLGDLKLDTWIIRVGYTINSLTYIGYGLSTKDWQFYLWSALHATSIISSPSLKSLLTSFVEPSQFGAVLGAFQIIDSIAGVFSPVVISWVFALTVKTRPEFVWYCCAFLTGLCTVLSFMVRQKKFGKSNLSA